MSVVSIGEHPEYIEEVAKLIESQWKKGLPYRINRLSTFNCSPPSPPFVSFPQNYCFYTEEKVVAQVTVKRALPPKEGYLYIESLVVDRNERGKGYGKKLVNFVAVEGAQRGFTGIVLKTIDAQGFYAKIGFQPCLPMHIQQGKRKPPSTLSKTAIQPKEGEIWMKIDFSAKIEKKGKN